MNIENIRRQRSLLKGKLTTIKNFVTRAKKELDTGIEEVTTRLQAAESIYARFQDLSQQLLTDRDEPDSRDQAEDTEFDERFYTIKAALLQLLERLKPRSAEASTSGTSGLTSDSTMIQILEQQANLMQKLAERRDDEALARTMEQHNQLLERLNTRSSTSIREAQVKLPTIKLPTFDGNMEEWKRYSDTFKTLIHDSELSSVQKHQYLVGSLSGLAAKTIESIEISENNYTIAWELLQKRYNDEKGIKKRHIQCLLDELPKIKQESADAIQELVDHVQKHLRILQTMKLPTESWGDLIIYLIEKNLDHTTRRRWEECIEEKEVVTTDTMMEFLQRQSQLLRRSAVDGEIGASGGGVREKNNSSKQTSSARTRSRAALATTAQEGKCYLCQGQHAIYGCRTFLKLSSDERVKEVKRLKLCLNCLRPGHFSRVCRSSSCRECGEQHNTLCHVKRPERSSSAGSTKHQSENPRESSVSAALCSITDKGEASRGSSESSVGRHRQNIEAQRKRILMATAIVNVKTSSGDSSLRVLLDSASELNFITSAACRKLNLTVENVQEQISGLNGMKCAIKHGCKLSMKSRTSNFNLNLYCLVVQKITKNLPSFSIQSSKLLIPDNLKLADPLFFNPSHIDALIGGEFFLQLLDHGKIELGDDLPVLQNTKLGWIIAGSVPSRLIGSRTTDHPYSNSHACLLTQQLSIDDTMRKFWELEEYHDNNTQLSEEEKACEKHFTNTISRDASSGRFVVRLPFRKNKSLLGRSREIAIKRLMYLERKFQVNSEFRDQYTEFMREYINLNHMSMVGENDNALNTTYLPHHGVIRESSLTTKLRVVFDASAKTTSGISLNDTLMVGANLQDNIIDIIMRFRLPTIAITADLQKMYRQILVHSNDRDYQRIFWRFSPNEPINEYKLNTVTYGQACAPFLAIRCVRQLAEDEADQFSEASKTLLNDLYVDDIITGVDREDQAIQLISQLESLLAKGGFKPHKWRTNDETLLRELRAIHRTEEPSALAIESGTIKTLGLSWCPKSDMFQFSMDYVKNSVSTKREVLSTISRLFDPLGLVGPILIRAKLIMQKTWESGLSWDESLPDNLHRAWDAWVADLQGVGLIQVPRRVIRCSNAVRLCLHAFCDASLRAYGACIYLQAIDKDNRSSSFLLCSKSRVAPVKSKTITLPRLELCGAVVLVRLLHGVRRALKVKFDEVHAWSDSAIALAWITGDPSCQKTFVSNRTAEIQSILPPDHWHHVDGSENPADLVSRGVSLKDLRQSKAWWEGPDWLSHFSVGERQNTRLSSLTEEDERLIKIEQKSSNRVFTGVSEGDHVVNSLLKNYSSLSKIERIIAWILRFKFNAKSNRDKREFGHISVAEIRHAHQSIVVATQQSYFADEISRLLTKEQLPASNKLLSLSPFLDEKGILRVGGRIQNSRLSFDAKHSIILPSNGRFTQLLFEREHRRLLHIGPQALLYSIRERYWPLRGKNIARRVVHGCITCSRNKPKLLSQIMGRLPADRIIPQRPFFVVGVDFAGPVITLINRGRGRRTNKSYISLFVCFATKAVHIEAVSDLSSASFIAALRRFTGRRGYPQRIYCDNATNFVGSKSELAEMYDLIAREHQEVVDEFCVPNNIEWKFIPPSAPHMGGLWEAGIKSCKFHLKRVIGEGLLTFEELSTVLIQIEACLNSRPICQMSSSVSDLQPLTPGHFLIGGPLIALPDIDVTDIPSNRLDRWQMVQKIARGFWKRWSREYLTSLQGKTKWTREQNNLSIDDVVMIQNNNAPPLRWKLGRVLETHKGADDNVRVVTLKTANGICKRSINKLCKLPLSDTSEFTVNA